MKYRLALAAVTLFGMAACSERSDTLTSPTPTAAPAGRADTTPALRDQYIVVFQDDVSDPGALADQLVHANGGAVRFRYSHALKGFAATLPGQALEAIRHNPNVSYVEADGILRVVGSPQLGPPSWGQDRADQHRLPLDNSYSYDFGGTGVRAYIIDTGIRFTHQEYAGRAFSGYDFIDNDPDASDCHGHGTHVAGTVGGNTTGIAKNVTLIAVRVLDCGGSGSYSQVIAGVDWVTNDHTTRGTPAVANMSLGGGSSSAVDQAVTNSIAAGIVYAVAAGNSNKDACTSSPASTPNALTVGATGSTDARASFSNYGSCVDLFAPGVGITSSTITGDNTYASWSGTSMATPHVAGVAALYLSANRSATPAQVEAAIKGGATADLVTDPMGSPNLLLYSRIAPPPAPDAPAVDLKVNGSDGPVGVASGSTVTLSWASSNVTSCSVSPAGWTGTSGSQSSGSLAGNTTYTVSCTGDKGTASDQVDVNIPPTADMKANGSDGPIAVSSGGEVTLSWGSTNAASCKVSPLGWTGTSQTVLTTVGGTVTFTVTCIGDGGLATDQVVVSVPDIKANGSDGPITVASGSAVTLNWAAASVTSCSVSPGGWTGTSGSQSSGPLSADTKYTLSCTGSGGTVSDGVVVMVSSTLPTADIKTNGADGPITVASGSAVTLSWTSSNTTSCSVSPGGWTGTSGSQSSGALSASTTYTVSCTGSGGTASDQVVVNLSSTAPTADIKANGSDGPITVASGSAVTLGWTSSNTTSCSVSPGSWTGTSGSQSSGPLSASTTYTVSCTGSGGTATDQVVVNVSSTTLKDVHVGDLDGFPSLVGKNWKATVVFLVHNEAHALVSGATVAFTISGATSGTATCVTASNGACSYSSGARKSTEPSVTFTVTGISGSGLRYVASSNHDPDTAGGAVSSDGTSIVVNRP